MSEGDLLIMGLMAQVCVVVLCVGCVCVDLMAFSIPRPRMPHAVLGSVGFSEEGSLIRTDIPYQSCAVLCTTRMQGLCYNMCFGYIIFLFKAIRLLRLEE